jgi:hypothetical protein
MLSSDTVADTDNPPPGNLALQHQHHGRVLSHRSEAGPHRGQLRIVETLDGAGENEEHVGVGFWRIHGGTVMRG